MLSLGKHRSYKNQKTNKKIKPFDVSLSSFQDFLNKEIVKPNRQTSKMFSPKKTKIQRLNFSNTATTSAFLPPKSIDKHRFSSTNRVSSTFQDNFLRLQTPKKQQKSLFFTDNKQQQQGGLTHRQMKEKIENKAMQRFQQLFRKQNTIRGKKIEEQESKRLISLLQKSARKNRQSGAEQNINKRPRAYLQMSNKQIKTEGKVSSFFDNRNQQMSNQKILEQQQKQTLKGEIAQSKKMSANKQGKHVEKRLIQEEEHRRERNLQHQQQQEQPKAGKKSQQLQIPVESNSTKNNIERSVRLSEKVQNKRHVEQQSDMKKRIQDRNQEQQQQNIQRKRGDVQKIQSKKQVFIDEDEDSDGSNDGQDSNDEVKGKGKNIGNNIEKDVVLQQKVIEYVKTFEREKGHGKISKKNGNQKQQKVKDGQNVNISAQKTNNNIISTNNNNTNNNNNNNIIKQPITIKGERGINKSGNTNQNNNQNNQNNNQINKSQVNNKQQQQVEQLRKSQKQKIEKQKRKDVKHKKQEDDDDELSVVDFGCGNKNNSKDKNDNSNKTTTISNNNIVNNNSKGNASQLNNNNTKTDDIKSNNNIKVSETSLAERVDINKHVNVNNNNSSNSKKDAKQQNHLKSANKLPAQQHQQSQHKDQQQQQQPLQPADQLDYLICLVQNLGRFYTKSKQFYSLTQSSMVEIVMNHKLAAYFTSQQFYYYLNLFIQELYQNYPEMLKKQQNKQTQNYKFYQMTLSQLKQALQDESIQQAISDLKNSIQPSKKLIKHTHEKAKIYLKKQDKQLKINHHENYHLKCLYYVREEFKGLYEIYTQQRQTKTLSERLCFLIEVYCILKALNKEEEKEFEDLEDIGQENYHQHIMKYKGLLMN